MYVSRSIFESFNFICVYITLLVASILKQCITVDVTDENRPDGLIDGWSDEVAKYEISIIVCFTR